MGGICGWIGAREQRQSRDEVLTNMLASLSRHSSAGNHSIVERACAIAVQGGCIPVDIHRSGTLAVAVQGRAFWKLRELQDLAAEYGAACTLGELYRRYGDGCLQHIGGPMAIAILDVQETSGLLAVDRMGTYAMCYANAPGGLVFGSTAESVAAHAGVGCQLSPQAIFDYLYFHFVPSPRTIFVGVNKLQPAECVVFRDGRVDRRFYWQLHYDDHARHSRQIQEERFHRLLREATSRAIDHDVDIGAFLSGGTDSSTVTGLLTELRGKGVKTYSIGFAAEGFDEMAYARISARHFKTSAHEYYVTPQDVVDTIPIIAATYDEPFGNDSAVPAYLCAKMAQADGVRVMLAGDGGDEIFGGNVRYAKQKVFEAYWLLPAMLRHNLLESLLARTSGGNSIPPLRKLRSYVQQASVPLPDRLESYNFLHRSPLTEILEAEFLAAVDTTDPLTILREVYERTASGCYVNRMMHLDLKQTLADNDLRKVSRMCDTAGVEVRFPLLDEALVEFAGELPASFKVNGLKLRHFFKRALKDFLPQETISKTKHGFGMPFGLWLRDHKPLANLVDDSLRSFQRRGIVRPDYITALLREHGTVHATYFGTMIWVVMMLERWLGERNM